MLFSSPMASEAIATPGPLAAVLNSSCTSGRRRCMLFAAVPRLTCTPSSPISLANLNAVGSSILPIDQSHAPILNRPAPDPVSAPKLPATLIPAAAPIVLRSSSRREMPGERADECVLMMNSWSTRYPAPHAPASLLEGGGGREEGGAAEQRLLFYPFPFQAANLALNQARHPVPDDVHLRHTGPEQFPHIASRHSFDAMEIKNLIMFRRYLALDPFHGGLEQIALPLLVPKILESF